METKPRRQGTSELVLCRPPIVGIYRFTSNGLELIRLLPSLQYAPKVRQKGKK